jgi:hypothetical protein
VGVWEAVTRLRVLAGEAAEAPVWPLSDDDLVGCLRVLHEAGQVVQAALSHLVREVEGRGVPAAAHASSTPVWLRELLHVSIHSAKRMTQLGRWVDERPVLDKALCAGAVNVEQARAIAAAVGDLPDDLGRGVVDAAEAQLIGLAREWEPLVLRRYGTRVLHHVAPDIADAADAAALERQERRAQRARALSLTRNGDGRVRVTGWLTSQAAAIVAAALDPLCAPDRDAAGVSRSPAQRRADALVEVCELAMRTDALPATGGQRPHLVVTLPFDLLRERLGVGLLDSGEPLTAEQVRRFACDAQILPAVLGGDGQLLDLGRTRRLITGSLRRALEARDRGCAFPGCDRPPKWCDGHHVHSWADGGRTSLGNAVLLCGFHHRVIHQGQWLVRIAGDGLPEFIPPPWADPQQRPRRNIYHRRQ